MPFAARSSSARAESGVAMKIGRYEVLDEIGHGAMGTVWRTRDPLIERTVAVNRTELLLEYTEQYPDVVQIDRQLEQLQDERRRHVRQLRQAQEE